MNVTPISMQMMIPQSNEAGNVQSNMQNQVNVQQTFESLRQKQDAELARQQVRAKEKASDDARGNAVRDSAAGDRVDESSGRIMVQSSFSDLLLTPIVVCTLILVCREAACYYFHHRNPRRTHHTGSCTAPHRALHHPSPPAQRGR